VKIFKQELFMNNTMKKSVMLLALAALVAGGVFAQRVGDTVQVSGSSWTVQSVSGDTMTLRKAQEMSYKVGDKGPGGGIIFYVNAAGFQVEGYSGATGRFTTYTAHYLEAAPQDSGKSTSWGPDSNISGIAAAAGQGHLGHGRRATMTIIASVGQTASAAQLAANATFGGLKDWFLPSQDELLLLGAQKNLPGLNMAPERYWSATQSFPSNLAIVGQFDQTNVTALSQNKVSGKYNVRAIRAF
jgi:hypothetical protein